MSSDHVRCLVIGAHPDDADLKAGGLAALYAERGHDVRFVSVTNGEAGHHELDRASLVTRRRAEARAAADVIGIEYEVWDLPDGELQPTLENRRRLIRAIREWEPDLLLTHRPNDYHPDHRATATLVRDTTYVVTVPNICPDTPAIDRDPVVGYLSDTFEKPAPFEPDVVVSIDDVIEEKIEMLHRHESQMYEWLAYTRDRLHEVPDDENDRRAWLREDRLPTFRANATRHRDALVARYGEARGTDVEFAEAIEVSEYGSPLTQAAAERLFPF